MERQLKSPNSINMLQNVRRICAGLPEAEELVDGFGHSVFKVRGKSFVMMGEVDNGDANLSFKSDRENQEILTRQEGFYRTPYIGQHGWVSIKNPQQWDELGDLLQEAYLRAAPKRLVRLFMDEQESKG
ncbi:MmcQ/YjbR family DNA-binding protein [Paenibacillus ginsengarvi]|uniref:MmcQ/YjbR family DNA-binding protein n=1 Tax=Paenibacillus ginsengarvi TaxID=400777 RepID=A0A3B0CC66_9BACL|nr:MmcQ/YjbR family DNA-binding protein [Paenibacillus ginsengarvi]RKN82148.1 MmcQ/YjbR family DNA-binding protein [Paenibacillus ginsengarvi]